VCVEHAISGNRDSASMSAPLHELANGPARRILHRDALGGGASTQRCLLVIGQSQCHRHAADGISLTPVWWLEFQWAQSTMAL
jgi:hypothetical protein